MTSLVLQGNEIVCEAQLLLRMTDVTIYQLIIHVVAVAPHRG